jgi:hypothetical protein
MKSILTLTCSLLAFVSVTVSSLGQSYTIDWYSINAGGGASTGGGYSLNGSIGQHDAGPALSGATFSLTGGFWSAVPMLGAPLLTIYLTNGNAAVVSWPSASAGFTLQQNASLGSGNWVAPTEALTDNGTNKFIIVNPPTGNRFYRLIKP